MDLAEKHEENHISVIFHATCTKMSEKASITLSPLSGSERMKEIGLDGKVVDLR